MKDFEGLLKNYPFNGTENKIKSEAKRIIDEHYENNDTSASLKLIFSCLEITSLKSTDNEKTIESLVEKVNLLNEKIPELPKLAGICVYPVCVETVKSLLIEEITYNAKGAFYNKSTYKYDDDGNQIEISWHKKNGELKYHVLKEYDENGNMTKEDDLIGILGERGSTMTYSFNDKNQVIETNFTSNDGMEYTRTTDYDEYGNIISENSVSSSFMNTFNYNYEYKYDAFGNWIERKETGNGPTERLTITERELTYY